VGVGIQYRRYILHNLVDDAHFVFVSGVGTRRNPAVARTTRLLFFLKCGSYGLDTVATSEPWYDEACQSECRKRREWQSPPVDLPCISARGKAEQISSYLRIAEACRHRHVLMFTSITC
jgi:hypothetical protein